MSVFEVMKRKGEGMMMDLSKKHSVVCSLTSFVAVEERTEGERLERSRPDIQEVLAGENVDILPYMGWEVDPTKGQAVCFRREFRVLSFCEK